MAQKRRKFSPQFKAEAVQMVLETDKAVAEVARDLWYTSVTDPCSRPVRQPPCSTIGAAVLGPDSNLRF